ncbi:uncharacterized protein B0J16DRAFT_309267 [Fusarium flagelliforme]|uniref:Uncharacterized protein n=1 Tax=Fusarium flagelliforme TaxID=2675880 RepID=A0A395M9D6_9HYPO|nr:uncharacterized protein B0J16DRAFT_309267 [Fusarium flagelliforme]KAH7179928.1 hypothetical protein B0J16DRAFT_309267 [Fusarium flagelliforme]RFN44537.1 hypothetical protein FIE12Z_11251 [Fusarium flagelliforme]
MSQVDDVKSPTWGSLPVERYLISKWDSSSTLTIEQQRDELVKAFLQEDDISPFASSADGSSSTEFVQTVLASWRPEKLRQIATKYDPRNPLFETIVVLRTCYGDDSNEKFSRWMKDAIEAFEEMDPYGDLFGEPEDRWWRILDDPSLGFEKWQNVYRVLPELATPELRRDFNEHDIGEVKYLVSAMCESQNPEEDDYEDAICAIAKIGFWLIVVDEEASKNEELLLVFMDKKGNVVRQTGIKPEDLPDLPHYNLRGSITESGFWRDGEVGKKYKTRGEVMRAVLPIVMAKDE